ncbi:MAG: sensor histidine kinase [Eubacteriales bacterium]|nr:sensor histidine kinase [Eubacteriales bacterium]
MKHYLRKKREVLIGAAFFWALFGVVYGLYGLPAGPFAYGLVLTGALLLCWLAAGYSGYRKHIKEIEEMAQMAEEGFLDLPRAGSLEEALYAQALTAVQRERECARNRLQKEWEDAKRYYALWSHQIKTPLAALKLLLQEEGPDRHGMELEVLKAEQYVEMALQYQRMAGGTQDLVLKEYELDGIVKQAVKRTAPLFIYKKLRLNLGEISGTAVTDEKWLVFILEQFLTNTVKYTKEGSVSIFQEGGKLVIADTGIGILPEDLPRVFEWGYTGFNGRADKHSTGIGLSLCRQMAERLDHQIRLESKPQEGTRVYLDLERKSLVIE